MRESRCDQDDCWPPALEQLLDEACDRFEAACQKAATLSTLPRIEAYLAQQTGPERRALLAELISLEVHYRRMRGETPQPDEYHQRFPEVDLDWILQAYAKGEEIESAAGSMSSAADSSSLGIPSSVEASAPRVRTVSWQRAKSAPPLTEAGTGDLPQRIGRFRVHRLLGEGGFGRVFLAQDDKLNRAVAIKVPHRKLVDYPEDAEAYLLEAQNVARLDHAHIVPVYDVGSTEEFPCFIVSKFIEGSTLAQKLKTDRPSLRSAAEWIATVAEALHYAHRKGLVHRDIKPGNILLDTSGSPYLADFGLALREENIGQGPKYAGTPVYMSPEQARGEGHRVDGRSDIFSLGVVFYELLTGRLPYRGATRKELLEQIISMEARPRR